MMIRLRTAHWNSALTGNIIRVEFLLGGHLYQSGLVATGPADLTAPACRNRDQQSRWLYRSLISLRPLWCQHSFTSGQVIWILFIYFLLLLLLLSSSDTDAKDQSEQEPAKLHVLYLRGTAATAGETSETKVFNQDSHLKTRSTRTKTRVSEVNVVHMESVLQLQTCPSNLIGWYENQNQEHVYCQVWGICCGIHEADRSKSTVFNTIICLGNFLNAVLIK